MPGLGFRPLHYQDAGAVHSVEQAENIIQTFGPSRGWGEKTIVEMILQGTPEQKIGAANEILKSPPVYGDRIGTPTADQITAETEAFEASQVDPITQAEIDYNQTWPTRQGVYDDAVRSETFEQFRGMQPTIGVNEAGWEALRRGETLSEETPELLGAPAYTEDMTETWQGLTNPPQGTSPFGAQYQAGGHVGRGTMAGELGRRGDLSVRQAGETMFERMKRLRGYAGGGYASRGTVAGELPRYGHMSVREEGESMGELHKRHRDQDWYNRMGGGLGSFRRRMA